MEQTLSDEAQRMTIAFDGLALLTGCLGADSSLPPGKVADFSGFQYLRDNDPTGLGHNTDFVTIIVRNVLNILSDSQIAQMIAVDLHDAERIVAEAYVPRDLSLRARLEPEGLKIELQGVPNGTLVVETTTELGEAWVPWDLVRLDNEGRGAVTLQLADAETTRFFRTIAP